MENSVLEMLQQREDYSLFLNMIVSRRAEPHDEDVIRGDCIMLSKIVSTRQLMKYFNALHVHVSTCVCVFFSTVLRICGFLVLERSEHCQRIERELEQRLLLFLANEKRAMIARVRYTLFMAEQS